MAQWLTEVFQSHGFNLVEMLHVMRNHETLQEGNAELRRRLGVATDLISAIRNKITELNDELEEGKDQISDSLKQDSA